MENPPRHRDSFGRFLPGNPGGPGRPKREVEMRYLEIMNNIVDEDAWAAIVNRAKADAIAGDDKARKFIANYLLGTPIHRSEVSSNRENSLEDLRDMIAGYSEKRRKNNGVVVVDADYTEVKGELGDGVADQR